MDWARMRSESCGPQRSSLVCLELAVRVEEVVREVVLFLHWWVRLPSQLRRRKIWPRWSRLLGVSIKCFNDDTTGRCAYLFAAGTRWWIAPVTWIVPSWLYQEVSCPYWKAGGVWIDDALL